MNEFPESGVTDTEFLDDASVAIEESVVNSQGHTTEMEEPTTATEGADWEDHVNRLVEQSVAERLANLDTEVERRVQSELQKRKNRADKQLAEDKRVIERMAQRGQVDAVQKRRLLAAAERDAEQYKRVWQTDDTEYDGAGTRHSPYPTDVPGSYAEPSTSGGGHIVSRAEIVNYLQSQGVDANGFQVDKFVGLRSDAAGAYEAFMAEVEFARGGSGRQPSEAWRVVQQFGGTATPTQRAGAPRDAERELERLLRTDPSTYDGGTIAYERRMSQLENQLKRMGKWE